MRRILLSLAVVAIGLLTIAQTPNSFNYQAVVRAADGKILQNSNVSFRFSILEGSATGSSIYVETRTATTNQYGLVNLTIGDGTVVSGDMANVNWAGETNFLKIDMDVNGGSSFTDMSTQQLVAVPYAMHANTVTNSDNDTTNEYQDISKSGATITLSDGGGDVTLDDDDASNELQDLSKSGSTISLSDGGGSVTLDDDDASNELQTISVSGIDLTLSDGGGTVSIADNDNNSSNELQTLSKSGINLTLSDGGGTISLADNDNNPSNEYQDLSLSGDSLGLTNSNVKVGLNGLNHWTKKNNDELYYNDAPVGIGTSNPNDQVDLDIYSGTDHNGAVKLYNSVNTNNTIATTTLDVYTTRNADDLGEVRGIYNQVNTSTDSFVYPVYGVLSRVFHSPNYLASNSAYGAYNYVQRSDSGNGGSYGSFNYVYHLGQRGSSYGSYNNVFSAHASNNYSLYGSYSNASKATGLGGTVYGSYSRATLNSPTSSHNIRGANHYATASPVSGGGSLYGHYVYASYGPDDAAYGNVFGSHIDVNRSDSGSGYSRAIDIDHNHTGNDGENRGIYLDMDVTGDNPDATFGSYFDIAKSGTGTSSTFYGSYKLLRRASSTSTAASSTSLGNTIGDYNRLVYNPASGSHQMYGLQQDIYNSPSATGANTDVRGIFQDINRGGAGNGHVYGYYLDADHTGTRSGVTGIYLNINESSSATANTGITHGVYTYINTYTTTNVLGTRNEMYVRGNNFYGTYGTYNYIQRSGTNNATNYGAYNNINDYQTGTGSRTQYGSYNYAYGSSTNGTTTLYGVYGYAGGNGDVEYAGYFAGNVYSTGSYLPSDSKLKSNLNSEVSSLDRIKNLQVMEYTYDTETYSHMALPEGTQTGFIAQEMAQVFPELTTAAHQPALPDMQIAEMEKEGIEIPDAAREGIDFTAVNYAGLVPHLTKAIQEQQDMIEQQQALIELMQAKIAALEAANESSNNE